MPNRLFQGVVHQMKDAVGRMVGVIDENAVTIACSELGKVGEVNDSITSEMLMGTAPFTCSGYTYQTLGGKPRPEYAVFVDGTDELARKYVAMLVVAMNNIKQYYDEKYDRNNFIKNVILDNILPGDIYLKARELRFNSDVERVWMLVRVISKTDISGND